MHPLMTHAASRCRLAAPLLVAIVALIPCSQKTAAAEPTPVLIDTDLGTGIGDAFALGLALGSHELEIRGITTVGDPAPKRALMACRFLTNTGRRTPVAAGGKPQVERAITNQHPYYYHPGVLFNRTMKPVAQPASEFLYARLKSQPGKITIVALGPLTNIARLLGEHPDSGKLIGRIIFLEDNVRFDPQAATAVLAAGCRLVMISKEATRGLALDEAGVRAVFSPGTALTRQVQALYQMWDKLKPPLDETLAVALAGRDKFVTWADRRFVVKDGKLTTESGPANARVIASVEGEAFIRWYTERMASLLPPERRPARPIEPGGLPHRVHVVENFDTDIERRWWMSGKPETRDLPPGSRRACRSVLTNDFDAKLGNARKMYPAVVFNPVPGPPMGKRTRLSFRFKLAGTDRIRVQIYSLTNGYHRHLVLRDLPQGRWKHAVVDMTLARRPDGTGGPLSEGERIDDIQFYLDPDGAGRRRGLPPLGPDRRVLATTPSVLIDDIVLYDAAPSDEKARFPKRFIFAGGFDTGRQGNEWPGDFEIVADDGYFWKAARSVQNPETKAPWIRLHMRGRRQLAEHTRLTFRYRASSTKPIRVSLVDAKTGSATLAQSFKPTAKGEWRRVTLDFKPGSLAEADEIRFTASPGGEFLIDDVMLYEPGS